MDNPGLPLACRKRLALLVPGQLNSWLSRKAGLLWSDKSSSCRIVHQLKILQAEVVMQLVAKEISVSLIQDLQQTASLMA